MHTYQTTSPILVDEKAAAKLMSISIGALRTDRLGARKIPVVHLGRRVRYSPFALAKFIEELS